MALHRRAGRSLLRGDFRRGAWWWLRPWQGEIPTLVELPPIPAFRIPGSPDSFPRGRPVFLPRHVVAVFVVEFGVALLAESGERVGLDRAGVDSHEVFHERLAVAAPLAVHKEVGEA